MSYPLKILGKIQSKAAIWILEAFKTSLLFSIEAIASLISINRYLQKLSERSQLQAYFLSFNHIICSLIEPRTCSLFNQHLFSLRLLTRCQYNLVKGPLVDIDNRFNEVFPFFVLFHPKFSPSHRVIDIFPSYFSFHSFSKQKDNSFKTCIQQLDNLAIKSLSIPLHALIIIDASIKNNITTSISYMHIHNKPITKTLYYTVNVMSIEAKLFAIRCSINQATSYNVVSKIIIITDSIYATKNIFDPTSHPY